MISHLLASIIAPLLGYVVFYVAKFLYHDLTSPLRGMRGPQSPSLILGNFMQIADDGLVMERWRQEYGPNFVFTGLFNVRQLHTSDIKAIAHIISRSGVYRKDPAGLYSARRFFGNGLLSAELSDHTRQRKVMNPAFGSAQLREMLDVFMDKSTKLRDIWDGQITETNATPTIEVFSWLRRMTLDIIGEAGFNYEFDALYDKSTELNQVFTQLSRARTSPRVSAFRFAQAMIPILRLLPAPESRDFDAPRNEMFRIGKQLVQQTKLVSSEINANGEPLSRRRDLLSLLINANVAADVPEHQRLSEEEVVGQIPTFFIAGHGTTSVATAWALHALSINRGAQEKLREELLTIPSEIPTMDELNSLVYLDSVVRETMRLYSPIVSVERMAMQDDVLPLSTPYVDSTGAIHDSLRIRKGQMIHIATLAVNTDKEIWGLDASEFKPERWERVPKAASAVPGIWANLLTFFAGPHNCIGFRFSLLEQKAVLFTLIRAFEFEKTVPNGRIVRSSTPLQRPIVLDDPKKTHQLPLTVKRYRI